MAWWEPTTGSFTCVAAYQAIGAASLAASYVNLANPGTNDAAPGDAPTFDTATGWTFGGSTDYLTTGIVPNGGAYTCIVRFSDSANSSAIFGAQSSSTTIFAIFPNVGTNAFYYNNGGASTQKNPRLTEAVLAVAGQNTAYRNGVAETGTINQAWSGTLTHALYIGARNNAGTTDQYFNGKIQAIAFYSTTLDATQVAEISANMAALPVTGINGEATLTQAGNTLSATGLLPIAGQLSVTEAGNTLSAAGTMSLSGVVNITQDDNTLSATIGQNVYGQLIIEQAGDTLSASGYTAIAGEGVLAQAGDTLVAVGLLSLTGVAVLTQEGDTLIATIGMANFGSVAIMQADNTLSAGMVVNRLRSRYRGTVRSIGNIRINEV